MPVFESSEQFYTTMRALFERLSDEPDEVALFRDSGMVVRIRVTDPDAVMTFSGRQGKIGASFGRSNGRADLELMLPARVLHRVWMGEIRLRDALARGDIQARGAVWKALQLAPLFRRAEALYPDVLREQGIDAGKN